MRTLILLLVSSAGSLTLPSIAFAHGVIGGGDEDAGNGLFWLYGFVLAAIVGTIIYRKWCRIKESPERRAQKTQLREFERALKSCQTQLQNAENYPKECGLTQVERQEQVQSAASIQEKIDEIKAELATN